MGASKRTGGKDGCTDAMSRWEERKRKQKEEKIKTKKKRTTERNWKKFRERRNKMHLLKRKMSESVKCYVQDKRGYFRMKVLIWLKSK